MDKSEFRDANEEIAARVAAGETDLKPARATSILLGITKASLTDSFLSAASFQRPPACLPMQPSKAMDPLMGLKSNHRQAYPGRHRYSRSGSRRQGRGGPVKAHSQIAEKTPAKRRASFVYDGRKECASAPERVPLPGRTASILRRFYKKNGRGKGGKPQVHQSRKRVAVLQESEAGFCR